MTSSPVASAETVSFYCHNCSARFSFPASSSTFTLCPRCRRDYIDDSPTPHRAPQPVPPPPPPEPPFHTWNYFFGPSDCPPRTTPPPPVPSVSLLPSSSSTSTLPRTLVSPCVRPSSSSTSTPPPTPSHDTWEYFFGPFDPVAATGKEGPPLDMSVRQVCREFRVLCDQEEQHRSSPDSPQSSAYSSACSSPLLASPPLHQQHRGELQPDSSPLTLSSPTTGDTTPTSQDLLPPPPLPLPWDSPLHSAWDDEYSSSSSDSDFQPPPPPPPEYSSGPYDSDFQRPPPPPPPEYSSGPYDSDFQRPPPPPPPPEYSSSPSDPDFRSPPPPPPPEIYDSMLETPFRRGLRAALALSPPVSAYNATFDTPLQRGGSQAAPAESIASLPTVAVTDTALVCPICTDTLQASAPARRLPCGHMYHSDCIITWLSLRNSCPVCRGSIPMIQSTATDIASLPSPSLRPTPPGPAGGDLYLAAAESEGSAAG